MPRVPFFPLLLLVLAVSGCAAQNVPDSDALRRAYDDSRTKTYSGVNVQQAMHAAARIFELVDGGYGIMLGKGGVVARREREVIGEMLSGEPGDYWYVNVLPSGDGVSVRVRRASEPDPNTSLDPADHMHKPGRLVASATIDPEETWASELTDSGAVYAIFFKRMDWLLARNNYWLYCRAAEEYVKMEKLSGSLDPLCLEAKDKRPAKR